ncbi:MAG: 2,3-bisphosphoglycerate-independent phosphoglycerate mutase [Pseudomonadota bacterium]
MSAPKPVILCILDGWGLNPSAEFNAVAQADTPTFDALQANAPQAELKAHGDAVGLPDAQMGNSEVGHMTIGAGRVIWMDLPRIDNAIADGSFASNPGLIAFITDLKASGGVAHLAGLVSPGGVHAHQDHIVAAARVIAEAGVPVRVHAFTDGRDVAPKSAATQVAAFEKDLPEGASIATVSGRFFAMDRDTRWERVEKAYRAMTLAEGKAVASAAEAIESAYESGETDEFITPSVVAGYDGFKPNDGLFFCNFRADRAREILEALVAPEFTSFERLAPPPHRALGMVSYSDRHDAWMPALFPSQDVPNTLGAWVAAQGKTQFRIAETEKYPHVTFFLNGGVEAPHTGEERLMPPSPKVKTYDLAPEMSAAVVTAGVLGAIAAGHDMIVVNFANPDMVGHTGDLEAAKAACAAVDAGLGQIVKAVSEAGGAMVVTADHGNCEVMRDPTSGEAHTAHTLNPVPVMLVGGPDGAALRNGRLSDLAPTILDLMQLPKPPEMTGTSLIS